MAVLKRIKLNRRTLAGTVVVSFCIVLVGIYFVLHLMGYKNYMKTASLWFDIKQQTPFFESSFESENEIKDIFILNKIEPHSWKLNDNYSSDGDTSLLIQIRSGDKADLARGKVQGAERAEFQDPLLIPFNSKREIWFRLDFMVLDQASFPVMDERLVFLQLKQFGGNNPLISLRYRNGRFGVKLRQADIQKTYPGPKMAMKKWYRVVVHARITKSQDGFVDMYLDNSQIIKYVGRTAYPKQPSLTFTKFGLYRNYYVDDHRKLPSMAMHFDRYIRGSSWEEVVPEGDPKPTLSEKALWPVKTKQIKSK